MSKFCFVCGPQSSFEEKDLRVVKKTACEAALVKNSLPLEMEEIVRKYLDRIYQGKFIFLCERHSHVFCKIIGRPHDGTVRLPEFFASLQARKEAKEKERREAAIARERERQRLVHEEFFTSLQAAEEAERDQRRRREDERQGSRNARRHQQQDWRKRLAPVM